MFGRKRRQPAAGERVTVAVAPVRTIAPPPGPIGYVTGWAPAGFGQSPHEQIGAYAGTQLTQRAGNVLEMQLRQGVEGLSAGWFIPSKLTSSLGYLITMRAGNAAEVQRITGGSNGQIGPITARTMRANVTAQSVRQSGLAAVQWAQSLSPQA